MYIWNELKGSAKNIQSSLCDTNYGSVCSVHERYEPFIHEHEFSIAFSPFFLLVLSLQCSVGCHRQNGKEETC